jgi:hypothetical protein
VNQILLMLMGISVLLGLYASVPMRTTTVAEELTAK